MVTVKCKDPGSRPKVDSETGEPLKPNQMTDETPWAQLASLALFKMFNDWQSNGFIIPAELLKSPDAHNNQGTSSSASVKVSHSEFLDRVRFPGLTGKK